MTFTRKKVKIVLFLFWGIALSGALYGYLAADLTINELLTLTQTLVQRSGSWGPVVYILVYSCRSLVFFPASVLTIISGMVFGPWFGLLYTLIGENISANVSYVVGRYLMSDIERCVHKRARLFSHIIKQIQGNGFLAVLFMRLAYLPFDFVGYSSGIFKLNQKHFALGTLLGTIPGLMAYTFLGSSVINFNFIFIGSSLMFVSLLGAVMLKNSLFKTAHEKANY
jgi:uncharacterized membrane protein YdjX (TVP38/TMEM64 family)